jgi:regulator of sigma E protease
MTWLYVFLGFSLLIILHEGGHFLAAKATGMRVERFFLFFGPTIWSFKRGETEYGIKSIPLGGYVKITGMNPEEEVPPEHEEKAYYRQKVWKRIVVVAAGPAVNIVLAFVILFGVRMAFGTPVATESLERVLPGTPAAKVLQPGDRILAIDGQRYAGLTTEERVEKFRDAIESHECAGGSKQDGCVAAAPVRLTIERDGTTKTVSAYPEYDSKEGAVRIGFGFGTASAGVSAGEAASKAGSAIWEVAEGTFHVFSHIFEKEEREQVSGVVGISDAAHETLEGDRALERGLLLLALVSLSLGLVNLLPILPLDGGHIFWAVVEKLRGGKPVSLRVMERATVIGFALVMALFFLGLSNDIGRITGEGFNAR